MSQAKAAPERLADLRNGGYFTMPRCRILVSGKDAERYLNGQLSNAMAKATRTDAVHATVLTPKGKLCAEVRVSRLDDSRFLIDSDEAVGEALAARLDRYLIADEVELEDVSEDAWLGHVYGDQVGAAPEGGIRSERLGVPGLDFYGTRQQIEALAADLQGAPFLDAGLRKLLRIERGIPEWGAELDENTMPAEAGLQVRAVDFEKGCYVGQETVSRLKSVGHANRALCGVVADDANELVEEMILFPREADETAKPVGRITSAAWDFGLSKPVGLAYVKRGSDVEGTSLMVATKEGNPAGAVTVNHFPLIP